MGRRTDRPNIEIVDEATERLGSGAARMSHVIGGVFDDAGQVELHDEFLHGW